MNKTLNYIADEYCPRYIPNDSPDGFEIAYTDRIFKERLMEGNMTADQVITFCNTRLKKAAIKGNGLYTKVGGYTREIMKLVACTSAVPFKVAPSKLPMYKRWFEDEKTFEHCWNTFAEEIISLSGAKIIVLAGKEVLDAFEGSTVKLYRLGNRLITGVEVAQGGMKRFDKYFGENSCILETLRARVNDLVRASRRQLKKELG